MTDEPLEVELVAAHCWEADDRVPRNPAMTAFRRRARLHQARWREAQGHPIGTQPLKPPAGRPARPVGSRLPLDYAQATGANFVTAGARAAATARLATKEPRQSIDAQRLWADLLWSPALACNLFGDLAAEPEAADRALHTWWPDVPETVREVRFLHSPGWLDLAYTGSLVAFDAAFLLDAGVVAVDTTYRERAKREIPKPIRIAHYMAIAERSGVFGPGLADEMAAGSELVVMWLQHLLVLSMLQHPSDRWRWGRLVVVHPAGNTDVADLCARYRDLLVDPGTFTSLTLEDLLDNGALPADTTAALRDRYVVG
jgi:hypothetical protein